MTDGMTRILFVCMGNICRSPTAEGVFRHMVEEAGLSESFHIDSAGTHGWAQGRPAESRAITAAARRGYDLAGIRSRPLEHGDYLFHDRIYAMDGWNLVHMLNECLPEHRDRITLFLDLLGGEKGQEVPDPYMGEAGFEHVLDLIESASRALLEEISPT